jgi:hypothetical protein
VRLLAVAACCAHMHVCIFCACCARMHTHAMQWHASGNNIGDSGVAAVAGALKVNSTIVEVDLGSVLLRTRAATGSGGGGGGGASV